MERLLSEHTFHGFGVGGEMKNAKVSFKFDFDEARNGERNFNWVPIVAYTEFGKEGSRIPLRPLIEFTEALREPRNVAKNIIDDEFVTFPIEDAEAIDHITVFGHDFPDLAASSETPEEFVDKVIQYWEDKKEELT